MKQTNNKKGLIIATSLVVIGAISFYLYKKSKDAKKSTSGGASDEPPLKDEKEEPPSNSKPKTTPSKVKLEPKAPPINIEDFQDWMDKMHPNWLNGKNLNKKSGYGVFGPSTKNAWATYGTEYKKTGKEVEVIGKRIPLNSSVIAKIPFKAFAIEKRNGRWFSTDANGKLLPSWTYAAQAEVGKVAFYHPQEKGKLIIFATKYNERTGYPFLVVKDSWVE